MSHFTKIGQASIVDASAFIEACCELGFKGVRENVEIKDYFGKKMVVDVAIKCGNYDIALVKNSNGTFDMVGDWWGIRGSGMPEKMKNIRTDEDLQNMLLKHTTARTIVNRYKRQGFRANIREDENEDLQIELIRR